MAIFHFQANAIQRSKGRSSVAAAAYRAGTSLTDDRTGLTFDYSKKKVDKTFLVGWTGTREELWNAAEAAENRKDSTTAREYVIALPAELTEFEREHLARTLARIINTRYSVAVDVCLHGLNSKNPHAHLLTTTREACPIGNELGAKSIVDISHSEQKKRKLDYSKSQLETLKKDWCELVNNALAINDFNSRITHLSFKKQGINNRKPQIKTYGNKKRIAINNDIKESNKLLDELDQLHLEKYSQDMEYEQFLEQVEPPTAAPEPEPGNELDFSLDNDALLAQIEAQYALEDAEEAAAHAATKAIQVNRNNTPLFVF